MCFSFESSIRGWLVTLIGCIFLLLTSQDYINNWIIAFALTFTQIQLIEAMIWKDVNNNKKSDLVKYIPILLWCQPLIQSFAGYMYSKNKFLLYMTFIYLLIIVIELNTLTKDEYSVKVSDKGHLIWNRFRNGVRISILGDTLHHNMLYLFGLVSPVLFIDDEHKIYKYALIGFAASTFLYSYTNFESSEFSSMWCYYSVNYITVANLLNAFQIYNQ